jgi:putative restriction endonuclease
MNTYSLENFIRGLKSLKRASTKFGLAPHKPVLLLTFIEMIDKGMISENRVFLHSDLVGIFQENWQLLVDTPHQSDFTQPFFYLQNDKIQSNPFWFLKPKPGYSINSHIKSVNTLSEVLDYGYFLPELYFYLSNRDSREILKTALLDNYFPNDLRNFFQAKTGQEGYLDQLELYVLNKATSPKTSIRISQEEVIFVRNGIFKKMIPKIYNNSCCFTGLRLTSLHGYSLIDACHIVPFSYNQNDTISNGLALCPNMHRAFDRGLLTVDNSFRIIVSKHIYEDETHPYSLKLLGGVKIKLPFEKDYFPSQENLAWHRENIFKG